MRRESTSNAGTFLSMVLPFVSLRIKTFDSWFSYSGPRSSFHCRIYLKRLMLSSSGLQPGSSFSRNTLQDGFKYVLN